MDKNFVSVDDLVRQRLEGGEERERSGAWLQMRDLLDKEMPQAKPTNWRRMFGGLAAVLLITSISLGGYELTANRGLAGNSDAPNTPASAVDEAGSNAQPRITATIESTKTSNKETNNSNNEKTTIITSGVTNSTGKNILAADHKSRSNHKQSTAASTQFITKLLAANAANKKKATVEKHHAAATTVNKADKLTAAGTSLNNKTYVARGTAGKTTPATSTNEKLTASVAKTNVAGKIPVSNTTILSSTTPVSNGAQATAGALAITNNNSTANKADISKPAYGSGTPSTKNLSGTTSANLIGAAITGSGGKGNIAKPMDAAVVPVKPSANTGEKTVPAAVAVNPAKISKDEKALNDLKELSAINLKRNKRVIEKMVLMEHYVKTAPDEGYYKLDTISTERVSDELGLNKVAASGGAAETSSKKHNTEERNEGPDDKKAELAANSLETDNSAVPAAGSAIVPAAASESAGSKPGTTLKNTTPAAAKSSLSAIQKLSAAFNDIKVNIGRMQFAPGLTAGVNGTFFGPSSFKGFQFGFTGNFIFSESFNIMTELKYFHRINNDYSLSDNYYTYTPTGGGQYAKSEMLNSYSFATLHSIELPVTLRYSKGNFNFYAGGNVVYTFAINTGAAATPSTDPAVTVTSIGNDNAPKLNANDFDSRLGLGYLLGLSYQLNSNVSLDFRNVQTIWDNAASAGSKSISNQLYKSPSFQMSVGYRLGGNKVKN